MFKNSISYCLKSPPLPSFNYGYFCQPESFDPPTPKSWNILFWFEFDWRLSLLVYVVIMVYCMFLFPPKEWWRIYSLGWCWWWWWLQLKLINVRVSLVSILLCSCGGVRFQTKSNHWAIIDVHILHFTMIYLTPSLHILFVFRCLEGGSTHWNYFRSPKRVKLKNKRNDPVT